MIDLAKKALKVFHDNWKNQNLSFDELVDYYRTDQHLLSFGEIYKDDTFLQNFGQACNLLDWNDVKNAMERLALLTPKEKIPNDDTFYQALQDTAENFTWSDVKSIAKNAVNETKEVVAKVAAVGVGAWILKAVIVGVLVSLLTGKKAK